MASGFDTGRRASAASGSRSTGTSSPPSIGPAAVERATEAVDDAPQQRIGRAHEEAAARRLHLVVRTDADQRAERHSHRLAAIEADHLARERLAAAQHAHDVADAHAGHAEAKAEAGHGEDAPGRSQRGSRGELRLEGVEAASDELTIASVRYFAAATRALAASPASAASRRELVVELLNQLLCAVAERGGHVDLDDADERAAAAAVETRDALVLDGEDRARLRAGRNGEPDGRRARVRLVGIGVRLGLSEGGHADLGAERRVRERDVEARHEIGAVALEARVLLDVDLDVEIAGGRAHRTGHALPGHAEALAGVDAGRERHHHLARLLDGAPALARLARMLDDDALALTLRARRREHDEAAGVRDVAAATTVTAGLGLGAGLGARAAAVVAANGGVDGDLALDAERGLAKGQPGLHAEVAAAGLAPLAATSAAEAPNPPPENISAKRSCM